MASSEARAPARAGRTPAGRRLVEVVLILAFLSVALFYLLHLMPGRTEDLLVAANPDLGAEDVARIRRLRGLDRPIHERYVCWLVGRRGGERCAYWPSERGLLGGDLGYSSVHKLPVSTMLRLRLPNTLAVMVPAFALSLLAAVPLGVLAARRRGRALDRAVSAASFVGLTLPTHWLGLLAVLVFAVELRLFPASGVDDPSSPGLRSRLAHAALPIAVVTLYYAARFTRFVRAAVLEVLELDFVRAARAKGLSERAVLYRHALPNALLPLITVVAQSLPMLFSGSLVVERVFAYPGIGLLVFESVSGNDHLVAIVVFLVYAALTLLASLAADVVYARVDPRVRVGSPLDERGGRG